MAGDGARGILIGLVQKWFTNLDKGKITIYNGHMSMSIYNVPRSNVYSDSLEVRVLYSSRGYIFNGCYKIEPFAFKNKLSNYLTFKRWSVIINYTFSG